jgi:hypothetical protein
MKNIAILFLIVVSAPLTGQIKEIPDTIYILGIDFSHTKIVTKNKYSQIDIIKNDFPRMNQEFVKDCRFFAHKFQANYMAVDTNDVSSINYTIDPSNLIVQSRFIFQNGDSIPRSRLKDYKIATQKNCIGLLLVMEKIDEIDDRESFYLMMIDLYKKEIIHCEKVESGLSRAKNNFGSGWFSWKTATFTTLKEFDDAYDFWNNYPSDKPIDINAEVPPRKKFVTGLK